MKKIKITENQLKKLLKNKSMIDENLDIPDDPSMGIKVRMAIFSHLSDIQEMGVNDQTSDRINFIKKLLIKYPDTNQEITTRDLDQIYNEMLGLSDDDINDMKQDELKPNDNPFSDGYDFSLNESVNKIKSEFKRFL